MSTNNVLELVNVSKVFPTVKTGELTNVLEDINLKVEEGEFISIVGPSGCGKSTILRLIAGLIQPTFGEVKLNGKVIKGPNPNRGMVFQKPTLFPWLTVKQNVEFSLKMQKKLKNRKDDSTRLIEAVGLGEFSDFYPQQLSGGMAQRVALIRSMINHPMVFLLDEPLGALDAFTRMNMQDELLKVWEENKAIMIMVTHDIDEAIFMGSKVVIMRPNPGTILKTLDIDLEYPRARNSDAFFDYRREIMDLLDIGI